MTTTSSINIEKHEQLIKGTGAAIKVMAAAASASTVAVMADPLLNKTIDRFEELCSSVGIKACRDRLKKGLSSKNRLFNTVSLMTL